MPTNNNTNLKFWDTFNYFLLPILNSPRKFLFTHLILELTCQSWNAQIEKLKNAKETKIQINIGKMSLKILTHPLSKDVVHGHLTPVHISARKSKVLKSNSPFLKAKTQFSSQKRNTNQISLLCFWRILEQVSCTKDRDQFCLSDLNSDTFNILWQNKWAGKHFSAMPILMLMLM